ncbi:chemotaxis protein CheC [Candidatus Micrarchaeota archaeon]|nr:chemotaxis protein CheC [Candidatus Micrarchaeota archaeon]MBU1939187.1 chemotaxis protein CheC [Candidatus Micrarchaeota archaeon]
MAVKAKAVNDITEEIKLTLLQEETLKEMGNVSSAQATDKLSHMLGAPADIKVPFVQLVHLEEIFGAFIGPREMMVSSSMKMFSTDPAILCVLYNKKTALHLVDLLFKREIGTTTKLESGEISAFIETSNIIINSYMNTMSKFFDTELVPETPKVVMQTEHLMEEFEDAIKKGEAYALVLGTRFEVSEMETMSAQFMLVVGIKTLKKLLKSIDKKAGEAVIY